MSDWRQAVVAPDASIVEVIAAIDAAVTQIALIVDADGMLLGTVTDGDVRRGILKKIRLDEPVSLIMNRHPITAHVALSRDEVLDLMRKNAIRHVPVIDGRGRIVRLDTLTDLLQPAVRDNWVVLMAGGMGTRLLPLTENVPKPLLHVGDKPLLETIVESFVRQGFTRFFISLNYKSEMVKSHFGDGSKWHAEIRYLEERMKLGTAGCLSLLPETPRHPLIVMNGDLLTKVNFGQLLDFHVEYGAAATMCVREYDFQVPYGVARIENDRVVAIEEKPVQKFFVNAGIYVLDPTVLESIPRGVSIDMTTVVQGLIARNLDTAVFPVREYWLDVGRMDDFERANGEFASVFAPPPQG